MTKVEVQRRYEHCRATVEAVPWLGKVPLVSATASTATTTSHRHVSHRCPRGRYPDASVVGKYEALSPRLLHPTSFRSHATLDRYMRVPYQAPSMALNTRREAQSISRIPVRLSSQSRIVSRKLFTQHHARFFSQISVPPANIFTTCRLGRVEVRSFGPWLRSTCARLLKPLQVSSFGFFSNDDG